LLRYFLLLTQPAPSYIFTLSLHDALPIFMSSGISSTDTVLCAASLSNFSATTASSGRTILSLPASSSDFASSTLSSSRSEVPIRSEEHTSELQSRFDLVCRLLLEKKKK